METRELYREKYEAQMREWNAKLEEIKARSERLGAQARLDMQPHVDRVHTTYEAAYAKMRDMVGSADDTWEDVKRTAEEAWLEFKAAVEGAYDALRSHGKRDDRAS